MHDPGLEPWTHSHTFGQERRRPGEARTRVVIALTATMMVVEIAAGAVFGSMALLADGLHMASHAAALAINALAYAWARRHAGSARWSFGTGKVNALGGFTGAVLLAVFALLMAVESCVRLLHPVAIVLDQAILVAVLGLLVNGASVFVLGVEDHDHGHDDGTAHGHGGNATAVGAPAHHHDHNLRSAYLHVLADALTSVLAIAALLAAKYFGAIWMDPVMGIVGALLVARWSLGLLRVTSAVLLDREGPEPLRNAIREALEADADTRVTDLHLWSIGPGIYSLVATVVAHAPATPGAYRARLPRAPGLIHVAIEVHGRTPGMPAERAPATVSGERSEPG